MLRSIALEHVCCPLCGQDRPDPWAAENGYTAQQCRACGFVYVSPRPPAQAIDEAAQTGLHATERGAYDATGGGRFNPRLAALLGERIRALYPDDELLRRTPLRWLDVGCGFGELVAAVGPLVPAGSDVVGIDPCRRKVRVARRRGLNVSGAALDEIGAGYDVISFVNVFSHLPDPAAFLTRLRAALAPGGELILVTGNGADLRAAEYPDPLLLPDHLVFAGERHLYSLLGGLGFEVRTLRRYPHFYRDPLWLFLGKAAVKRALRRPVTHWRSRGPFRSLFVRARLSAEVAAEDGRARA